MRKTYNVTTFCSDVLSDREAEHEGLRMQQQTSGARLWAPTRGRSSRSHTGEARRRKWRILAQVAVVVWEEIPSQGWDCSITGGNPNIKHRNSGVAFTDIETSIYQLKAAQLSALNSVHLPVTGTRNRVGF